MAAWDLLDVRAAWLRDLPGLNDSRSGSPQAVKAGGPDRLPSILYTGGRKTLFHDSPDRITARTKQGLTPAQLQAGELSLGQLSSKFYRRGNMTSKIDHYVEIDITGLVVRQGVGKSGDEIRDAVQFILNDDSLDLAGRIVRFGKVLE